MAERVAVDVRQANLPNRRLIYDLISANNLHRIRSLLNPLTLRHRQSIVCPEIYNKTLLGHACELGFRDTVKYLLDECGADIFDRYTKRQESLTPLRVSVGNTDVSMILLLISRGAAVGKREARVCTVYALSKRYLSLSSILHICTNQIKPSGDILEHLKIFCCGTDIHYCDQEGVLYPDAIFEASAFGHIARIKHLISNSLDPKVSNDTEENALCLSIFYQRRNMEHFLLNYRLFSMKDHVLALELIGAKYIAILSDFKYGLRCWRKAIRIRTEEFFGVSDKLENPLETDLGLEFLCEEQLDKLANQKAELYIQSLLVCSRLLSPVRDDLTKAFILVSDECVVRKDLFRVLKILGELSRFPYIPMRETKSPLETATCSLNSLFHSYFHSDPSDMGDFLLKFKYLMDFINGVYWKELFNDETEFYLIVYVELLILVVGNIIAMKMFDLCSNDQVWIKDGVSRILQLHSDPYPTTLLHLAIEEPTAYSVVPFLLGCSADANCTDKEKSTPMHAVSLLSAEATYSLHLVNLLADAGGHIDSVNRYNITPCMSFEDEAVIINPLKFLSLQCLAAQTIHKHDIKVSERYPKILLSFIKLHSC